MPSHSLVYPFTYLGTDGDDHFHRPLLPIKITSVRTGRYQHTMGLADTGADSCLIPGGITRILGCPVNSGLPVTGGASGIGEGNMPTWKHELRISLLTPDRRNTAFDCPARGIPCHDRNDKPILLGTIGFLQYFHMRFDYQGRRLIVEFDVP